MNRKLVQIACLALILSFLVGCNSVPAQPKIGDPLDAGDGLTVTVVEYKPMSKVTLFKNDTQSEVRQPTAGNTYYTVSVEMKLAKGSRTMPLNLDNIVLVSEDNTKVPTFILTYRKNLEAALADLRFISLDGDSKTLDFGLGFTGMDMTMTINYKDGVGRLIKYYGPNPIILTFLFEVPQASKVKAFQFNNLAQVLLEK